MLQWIFGYTHLFKLWFSPDRCPGMLLLDHVIILFLVFWETSRLFSIIVLPVYIPTNSIRGFLFSIPSLAFIVCRFFDNGHSGLLRWYVIAILICISLIISYVDLFMCFGHLYVFFGDISIYIFCPFFFFLLFRATTVAYGISKTRGRNWAGAAGLHHSHSNMGSEPCLQPISQLTAMPDIKPASSWIIVGFITTEPQWELLFCPFFDWIVCFFDIVLHEMFVYFGDKSLINCFIWKCFLPLMGCLFVFFMVSFQSKNL